MRQPRMQLRRLLTIRSTRLSSENIKAFAMRSAWSTLITVLCAIGLAAHAEGTPLGFVKTLPGAVSGTHGGMVAAAALAMPVYERDRLETAADGNCGITFPDNTRISLGPNSRIELKHVVSSRPQSNTDSYLALHTEPWNTFPGFTEKLAPDSMSIETPGFTVGARGTSLLVRAEK